MRESCKQVTLGCNKLPLEFAFRKESSFHFRFSRKQAQVLSGRGPSEIKQSRVSYYVSRKTLGTLSLSFPFFEQVDQLSPLVGSVGRSISWEYSIPLIEDA
jgi:hypothetical protein